MRHWHWLVLGPAVVLAGCIGEKETTDSDGETTTGSGVTTPEPEEQVKAAQTLMEALADYKSCITWRRFMETGFYLLAEEATDDGQCQDCHAKGTGAMWAGAGKDLVPFYENIRTFPGVMRLVTGTVDERGNFAGLVPSRRLLDKGVEQCLDGDTACHPRYTLTVQMQNTVDEFVNDSLQRFEAGICEDDPEAALGDEEEEEAAQ